MVHHVDVQRVAPRGRYEPLEVIVGALAVHSLRHEAKATHDPEAVAVHGEDLPPKRVHQNAPGGLRAYARQGRQEPFSLPVVHARERRQSRGAEAFADAADLGVEAIGLDQGHPPGHENTRDLLRRSIRKRVPVAADVLLERVVDACVRSFTGPDRELDEDELVQRIGTVPERRGSVQRPQPLIDNSENLGCPLQTGGSISGSTDHSFHTAVPYSCNQRSIAC